MIGIIIEENFEIKASGGAEWTFAIKWSHANEWSTGVFTEGSDQFGAWRPSEFKVIS